MSRLTRTLARELRLARAFGRTDRRRVKAVRHDVGHDRFLQKLAGAHILQRRDPVFHFANLRLADPRKSGAPKEGAAT